MVIGRRSSRRRRNKDLVLRVASTVFRRTSASLLLVIAHGENEQDYYRPCTGKVSFSLYF